MIRLRWAGLALAAILASTSAPSAPGQTGTLANGNLEEEHGGGPARWRFGHSAGSTGAWTWDTENRHSGQRAFRVRKENAEGYSTLLSDFFPVEAGKEYELSAWVKLHRRAPAGIYLMVAQYRADSETEQPPNTFGDFRRQFPEGEWQQVTVRFKVREGMARVRGQGIVARAPCDVTWDDFSLTEASEKVAGPRYDPPGEEALPPLEPAQKIVAGRQRSTARVRMVAGRPRLFINGKSAPPCFYVSPFHTPEKAHIGDFSRAGVRVYAVPLVLGRDVYGPRGVWTGPKQYDFAEVDALLWRVLRVDPDGHVLLYVICDPYRNWGVEHPEEVAHDQDGAKAIADLHPKRWGGTPGEKERFAPSLVSETLRDDMSEALRQLVAHVRQSEPGKAVIGYHLAGSNDGQWFQWARFDASDLHLADYSPGAQRSYRNWLRRRYGNDVAALRRAWRRPDAAFETAAVPSAARTWSNRIFVDPATDEDLADYIRFYSEGVAETVLNLAQTVRAATAGQAIIGTYYEDISANSANHMALRRYLESKALDYLAGPATYGVRMPGQPGGSRNVFGSTLLHGKLYLTEQDWRSWRSEPSTRENNARWGRAESGPAHNAMVRRECGMMLAYGMGTWWYDMYGGWFQDAQIMSGIAEARRAFERDQTVAGVPRADVAVFVSEESNAYLYPNMARNVRHEGIVRQLQGLNTAGVPYRLYLLSDLGRIALPEHRLYLFLNAYRLDDVQRQAIAGLRRDSKVLVFLHAPGVIGEADPAAAVTQLTGIRVRAVHGERTRLGATPVETAHPLLEGTGGYLAPTLSWAWPAYEVADAKATPLARYPGSDAVSIATRQFASHQVVFAGCMNLSDQFLHNLAAAAGAWRPAAPGDAVYANEHFLTIHAIHAGKKTLHLARPSRVEDLTTGEVVSPGTTTIRIPMSVGETRWFALTPR